MPLVPVTESQLADLPVARTRWYCEQLEAGGILCFEKSPFLFPEDDHAWLLQQKQSGSRFHKNISYRPLQDVLRGFEADKSEDAARMHDIIRRYSKEVTALLTLLLAPYAAHWQLDFASYRPLEEQGRELPMNKRNDLLHVDAFPTRPTHGGRILRVFTNLNRTISRKWVVSEPFAQLAPKYAEAAGLQQVVKSAQSPIHAAKRSVLRLKRVVGLKSPDHSAYDLFMLGLHQWMKASADYQQNCQKEYLEFPSGSTWMAFLDGVPHAALSGQFAMEQTYIIPPNALVAPDHAPIRVLERMCGKSLTL